jgi:predicted RNA-binding protein with PUA-like domain
MGFKEHPEWRNKAGRGRTKCYYTVEDIARLKGVSIQGVRNYFSRNGLKVCNLRDVVKYCSTNDRLRDDYRRRFGDTI